MNRDILITVKGPTDDERILNIVGIGHDVTAHVAVGLTWFCADVSEEDISYLRERLGKDPILLNLQDVDTGKLINPGELCLHDTLSCISGNTDEEQNGCM